MTRAWIIGVLLAGGCIDLERLRAPGPGLDIGPVVDLAPRSDMAGGVEYLSRVAFIAKSESTPQAVVTALTAVPQGATILVGVAVSGATGNAAPTIVDGRQNTYDADASSLNLNGDQLFLFSSKLDTSLAVGDELTVKFASEMRYFIVADAFRGVMAKAKQMNVNFGRSSTFSLGPITPTTTSLLYGLLYGTMGTATLASDWKTLSSVTDGTGGVLRPAYRIAMPGQGYKFEGTTDAPDWTGLVAAYEQ